VSFIEAETQGAHELKRTTHALLVVAGYVKPVLGCDWKQERSYLINGWKDAEAHIREAVALEAAVRYIAAELGPKGIRVHAISPGPLATRAASGIPEFDELMDKAQSKAPSRSLVSIEDVGNATAFLALDGAKLITGGVLYIDGGYHIID
jgi:hypothetical protein